MMAQRSLLRPDQLDSNGSYNFAQLVIDGYSGGDLQDGYLTGLIFKDRANGGATRLEIHADNGEINQTGSGKVTLTGNVEMKANAVVQGDFTVNGTTTYINTQQMLVTDPITTLNESGSEALSSWTGLSERDVDGYNRTGWVFDGYWGLSTVFSANSDLVPDRAIAYIGAGDAYGDLSSTEIGDSGASKIGVDDSGVVVGDDVQEALENIFNSTADITGTPSDQWHVNNDATASVDEDACLLLSGGDGTALIDGYLCLITDSANGDKFQFVIYQDGVKQDSVVHVGEFGSTDDVNSCVVLNSGDGANAYSAELCLDGDGKLSLTGEDILLDGDVYLGTGAEDCIHFDGVVCSDILPCCDDAYDFGSPTKRWQDGYFVNLQAENFTLNNNLDITGDLTVEGLTTFDGCVVFNGGICSDMIPCCNDAYDIGDSTHRFNDGYFTNLDTVTVNATTIDATTITVDDIIISGDTTIGDGPSDCVIFNASVCSDILPCCDDAYDIGDSTHRFQDGYFVYLNTTTLDATTVNATDVNTTNVTATGDVSVGDDLTVDGLTTFDGCVVFNGGICSDMVPCCDDAYDVGDPTHRWQDGYFVNLDTTTLNVVDLDVTNLGVVDLTVSGDTILGDNPSDCVIFNASICSDIMPCCDDAYQFGDTTHRWIDGYFAMPAFVNITPVGDVNSLIGVLEGIDDALANISIHPERGVYEITNAEATLDILDTSRTPDQGQTVDVSGYTDVQFRDNIFIYWNGQMLYNDPTSAANKAAVQNDVARQTGTLKNIIFSGDLKKKAIIQIVDMT
jgi:hypothetical protein